MEFPETIHHKRILHSKRSFGKPPGHKVDSPAYDASVLFLRFPLLALSLTSHSVQRKIMILSPTMVLLLSLEHHYCVKMLPLSIVFQEPWLHVPPLLRHDLV
jgi:hypothetical protein